MDLRNAECLSDTQLRKRIEDSILFWNKELPEHQITLISAQGGTGKSFLAMYELLKIGNLYNANNTPVTSVYASAEDGIHAIQDRLKMLSYHRKETMDPLNFNNLSIVPYDDEQVKELSDGDDISYKMQSTKEFENNSLESSMSRIAHAVFEKQGTSKANLKKPTRNIQTQSTTYKVVTSVYMQEVINECIKRDANILLLDSLNILAPDGVETDNEKASQFLQHLKQQFFNNPKMPNLRHIIIIHHARKDADGKDPRSFVRGSGALYDNSRLVFILENMKAKFLNNTEQQAKAIIQEGLLKDVLNVFNIDIFVNIKAIKCNYSRNNDTRPLQYIASFYQYQTYNENGHIHHDAPAVKIQKGEYINNLIQLLASLKTTMKRIKVMMKLYYDLKIDKDTLAGEDANDIIQANPTKSDKGMTIDSFIYWEDASYTDAFKSLMKAIYKVGLITYINQRLEGFCKDNNMDTLCIDDEYLGDYTCDYVFNYDDTAETNEGVYVVYNDEVMNPDTNMKHRRKHMVDDVYPDTDTDD